MGHSGCRWLYGKCRIVDEDGREIRRWLTVGKSFLGRHYSYSALLAVNFIP